MPSSQLPHTLSLCLHRSLQWRKKNKEDVLEGHDVDKDPRDKVQSFQETRGFFRMSVGGIYEKQTSPSISRKWTVLRQLFLWPNFRGSKSPPPPRFEMERWDQKNVHINLKWLDPDYIFLIHTALQGYNLPSSPQLIHNQSQRLNQPISRFLFTNLSTMIIHNIFNVFCGFWRFFGPETRSGGFTRGDDDVFLSRLTSGGFFPRDSIWRIQRRAELTHLTWPGSEQVWQIWVKSCRIGFWGIFEGPDGESNQTWSSVHWLYDRPTVTTQLSLCFYVIVFRSLTRSLKGQLATDILDLWEEPGAWSLQFGIWNFHPESRSMKKNINPRPSLPRCRSFSCFHSSLANFI